MVKIKYPRSNNVVLITLLTGCFSAVDIQKLEWSTIASAIAVSEKAKAFLLLSLYSASNEHPSHINSTLSTTVSNNVRLEPTKLPCP